MAYSVTTPNLGFVDLYLADTAGPGKAGRSSFMGEVFQGYDDNLGGGEFMFVNAAGAINYGAICELTFSIVNGSLVVTAQPWAGTTVQGKTLGVAMQTLAAGQFGYVQVGGAAVATVSGAPAVGNPAYWQASGVVSPTPVASKQVLNAQFASVVSAVIGSGAQSLVAYNPNLNPNGQSGPGAAYTLAATQALLFLNRPFGQGAIT